MRGRRRARRSYDVVFYLPTLTPLIRRSAGAAGGAEIQVLLLARALVRRGTRVCVVAYAENDGLPSEIDGIDIVTRSRSAGDERVVGKLLEFGRIRRALAQVDAPVVVARTAPNVAPVAFVARALRRRFVFSSASYLDFEQTSTRFSRRDFTLYRLGLRLASQIVVQTEEQAQACAELVGASALVIPSIAEAAAESSSLPEAFLWIGRVYANKRPLAFVELARSLPHAKFRMIAVPSDRALETELERAAAGAPNLELLTPRPREDVLDLIGRAVAVVSTSDYEGMPNVFLEAWARGVPVLALSHDPDGVIERHGLGAFADGSHERLVGAAARFWSDRDENANVAAACRRYIEAEHSGDAVAEQWQRALRAADTRVPVVVREVTEC